MKPPKKKLEADLAPFRKDRVRLPEGCAPVEGGKGAEPMVSVRKASYRGKKIEIHTTYRILIDGKPLEPRVMVGDDGQVHCHGLPNYSFASAIDLTRKVIDAATRETPNDELTRTEPAQIQEAIR